MVGRRDLKFDRLDQVLPDVDRLMRSSERVGTWTLGQILHHLATAIRLTTGAADSVHLAVSERSARASRLLFFRAGKFPEGLEIPNPAMFPPIDADPEVQALVLQSAISRFLEHQGPFPVHPVLGPMTPKEWDAFHRIHCAHHLSFAWPTSSV